MTRPDACGAAGGAVSMWFRWKGHCTALQGLLTTAPIFRSGIVVDCWQGNVG